jgi:hypothetical protein
MHRRIPYAAILLLKPVVVEYRGGLPPDKHKRSHSILTFLSPSLGRSPSLLIPVPFRVGLRPNYFPPEGGTPRSRVTVLIVSLII